MPNWVANELTVKGSAEGLTEFRDRAARPLPAEETEDWETPPDGALFFQNFIPEPASVKARDYSSPGGGHEWEQRMWGAKWGVNEVYLDDDSDIGSLSYRFCTALTPPVEFVGYVSLLYPDLEFRLAYDEPGNNFAGTLTVRDGRGTHFERESQPFEDEDEIEDEDYLENETAAAEVPLQGQESEENFDPEDLRASPRAYVDYLVRRTGADPEAALAMVELQQ